VLFWVITERIMVISYLRNDLYSLMKSRTAVTSSKDKKIQLITFEPSYKNILLRARHYKMQIL